MCLARPACRRPGDDYEPIDAGTASGETTPLRFTGTATEPDHVEEPATKSSITASTIDCAPENGLAAASLPADERICLGPEFHFNETHAHVHHPGLLKGADFCYAGVATQGVADTVPSRNSSSDDTSSEESDCFSQRSGETHELVPGGGLSITKVKVTLPSHEGHSNMIKVRPSSRFDPLYRPITPGKEQDVTYTHSESKVRPPALGRDEEPLTLSSSGSPGASTIGETGRSNSPPIVQDEKGHGVVSNKGTSSNVQSTTTQKGILPEVNNQKAPPCDVSLPQFRLRERQDGSLNENLGSKSTCTSLSTGSDVNMSLSTKDLGGTSRDCQASQNSVYPSKLGMYKDETATGINRPYEEGSKHQIWDHPDVPIQSGKDHSLEDDMSQYWNISTIPVHYLRSVGQERRNSPIGRSENRFEEVYSHALVQSPIPVSRTRAGILDPVVISAQVGRSSASTLATSGEKAPNEQHPRPQRLDSNMSLRAEHGNVQRKTPPSPSIRSQSLGSVLDYGSPTRWLQSLLKQPQSYTSKLTEISGRGKHNEVPRTDIRRPSEPVLSSNTLSRRQTGKSTLSSLTGPHVDKTGFKRAVSDLERLLGEALSLATEVVERSESPPKADSGRPAATSHFHCHIRPLRDTDLTVSSSDELFTSAHESVDDLCDVISKNEIHANRPGYKHAATYSGAHERPRLADLIERYSQATETTKTTDLETDSRRQSGHYEPRPPELVHIPCRESSKHLNGRTASELCRSAISKDVLGLTDKERQLQAEDLTSSTTVVDFSLRKENRRTENPLIKRQVGHHTPAPMRRKKGDKLPESNSASRSTHTTHGISLRRRSHVSLRNTQGFSLVKSHKRKPIARDWSPVRKKLVASVACISTALIGMLLGIYAGLVPSIQYYIIDQTHATVHGNTGCFLGLALPTFFLWPLPLLHGRKPYIMAGLALAMPLLFPQALSVNSQRLSHTASWRAMLIASRTLMGGALGFASMNFHSILTDLFGASLMSHNPHQEVVDRFDARRHGGGMGVWLGMWTWCWLGSLGIGFLIGAAIIDHLPPAWGFYVSIVLIAVVLLLNVVCPEVRRSAFRRSVTEVRTGSDISRRLARGEIMMHRVKTGPKWWGEEVYHGILLSFEMLCQPGFAVMAVYVAWIYAQIVLIIVLLGALASQHYRLHATYVGLLVAGVSLGGVLAIPFQKANIFSRSRHFQFDTSRATLENTVTWSSHLVRRTVVVVLLPLAGGCYAAVSLGPRLSIGVPTFFAICIGFLSCLAVAECNGLIMETFDTSDLFPGMTGRPRGASGEDQKRTNYSAFPRVTAGFAVIHTIALILAAGATALGGHITRTLGQQVATAVVAGILFVLTVLLLLVLVRFKNVLIVPRTKSDEMDKVCEARRKSTLHRMSMPNNPQALMDEANAWRPFMIGNPVGKNRRMNVLELGEMTRWQDIRKKNKLIDEGVNLNRAALDQGLEALGDAPVFRMGSGKRHVNRSHRSDQGSSDPVEMEVLNFGSSLAPPQPHQYPERDCFMGQSVEEEAEDEVQTGSKNNGTR